MNIDSINNGIVIDHIQAGKAMDIYNYLGLENLDCSVAIIKNVRSKKSGKKDIIKIDNDIDVDIKIHQYINGYTSLLQYYLRHKENMTPDEVTSTYIALYKY